MLDIWMSGIARAGGIECQLSSHPRPQKIMPVASASRRKRRVTEAVGCWLIHLGQRLAGPYATA